MSARGSVLCTLLVVLVIAGSGGAAADDGLLHSTSDTVTGTVNNTTETLTGTVNDTTDTVTGTVNDTTDTVENTTGSLTGTLDGTTDSLSGTVDSTTDTVDGTVTVTDLEDSAAVQLVTALAENGELDVETVGLSSTMLSSPDSDAVATLLARDGGTDGGLDAERSEPERTVRGVGPSEDASGTPLPDVPAEGLVGGGLVGVAALGILVRQGVVSMGSPATLVGAASTSVTTAGSTTWERLTRLIAPLRYSRFDDSDPLEHEARGRLFDIVEQSPGAYLSEVSERAGVPLSTARHHARVLEREGLIASAMVRGRRRFYPDASDDPALVAALNDKPTAGLLDALSSLGPASVSALAEELDRDPSTITHHLSRLEEDGIVIRERDGRAIKNRLSPEAKAVLDSEVDPEPPSEPVAPAD